MFAAAPKLNLHEFVYVGTARLQVELFNIENDLDYLEFAKGPIFNVYLFIWGFT